MNTRLCVIAGERFARRLCYFAGIAAFAAPAAAAPPRPDRMVIVFEENKGYSQIIGSGQAPYINFLAQNGANFTSFYGMTHPSQPNYLEFFSGSNQGVTSNATPPNLPF